MAEKTIYVKLYLGEQDGYSAEVQTHNGVFPKTFYVHRRCDDPAIERFSRSHPDQDEAAQMLKDAAACLAYEFTKADPQEGVVGGKRYLYTRCPALDRQLSDDPAV